MARGHFPSQRATVRFSSLLLGGILTLFIFGLYRDPAVDLASTLIKARHADALGLEDPSIAFSNASLLRRDDYSCGAGNPCSNGACCGASGYCGYGPTYCGSGCQSNCGATAECGQYASTSGKQCPLNVCCSQYGFCGTTQDFCDSKCQSNCVLNPSPPGGGSGIPVTSNRVIGYYESWSARKTCHQVAPTDLPVDALTHVNFAFAYIDPGSYQIVTMDSSTPSSLFKDTTQLKSIKPSLSIFVSVGGWSFSDNNTATQPLYGEIAADAGKRQTFANNVVHFMQQYGFDGLDIDWEYPGAPDRGGQEHDTANYVALLRTLRQTFDASGGHFGLTFTAPSSYWYLRWFDLPNLIKFADWINFMTYDLHGVWDATDPIGSIVQGHTNLTEIKLAAELFWRVGVPPAKVVMGFGFYGRSFTLADPSCKTPGCPFSGASNPGPCTATGGILGYYEILDVLNGAHTKKRAPIQPTHDTKDAVNYFTFDNDQWVSYDDAVTFKQKTDWATSVGMGGALIWASDLDDDQYTAHAGLLGRSVQSSASLQSVDKALSAPQAVIQDIAGSNGQNCFRSTGGCVNLNDNNAVQKACGPGNTQIGWDDAGCGSKKCHCGVPICCPTDQAPRSCTWRGDNNGQGTSTDCSAQCFPGETNIKGIGSSWGGGFTNDGNTNKCGRGYKVFCCTNPDASQVTRGCNYAACRANCPSGTTSVFNKYDNCWFGSQQYCCPDDPVELVGCHWVGGTDGDCANAVCNATELEVDRATYGGPNGVGCDWGRQSAACCTINTAPPPPAICGADLCKLGLCSDDGDPGDGISKRGLTVIGNASSEHHTLLERGEEQPYMVHLTGGEVLVILAAIFSAIGQLYNGPNAAQVDREQFRYAPGPCLANRINVLPVGPGAFPVGLQGLQTEHPLDRQIMARFIEAANSGLLRNSYRPIYAPAPIPDVYWTNYWDHPFHSLNNAPAIGGPNGPKPYTAQDRVMICLGSDEWSYPLLPTDAQINGPKGALMNLNAPADLGGIGRLARTAVAQDTPQALDALLSEVGVAFAIFEYMNTGQFATRFNAVRDQVRRQLGYVETAWGVGGLQTWWDIFTMDYFAQIEDWAASWTTQAVAAAFAPYNAAHNRGQNLATYQRALNTLQQWETQASARTGLRFPPYGGYGPLPGAPGNGGGGGGGGA